jgi:succinyl-CoA synthetase beta subunit
VHLSVPLVVRLEGTNVEKGKRLLKESGVALITADDLADAAQKAVEAAKTKSQGGNPRSQAPNPK